MKPFLSILLAIGITLAPTAVSGDEKSPPVPLRSPVQIKLPISDVQIKYVESREGMVLIATCNYVSVQSQRFYLGDGKNAVLFSAGNDGFQTPSGKQNVGALTLKDGATIQVNDTTLQPWAARPGEIYLLVPNLKFKVHQE